MSLEWRRMSKAASAYRFSRVGASLDQPDLTARQLSIFWLCWNVLSLLEAGLEEDAVNELQLLGHFLKEGKPLPAALMGPLDPPVRALSAGPVKPKSEKPGTPGLGAGLDRGQALPGLSDAVPEGAADSQPSLEGVHGTPQKDLSPASSAQGEGRTRQDAPPAP